MNKRVIAITLVVALMISMVCSCSKKTEFDGDGLKDRLEQNETTEVTDDSEPTETEETTEESTEHTTVSTAVVTAIPTPTEEPEPTPNTATSNEYIYGALSDIFIPYFDDIGVLSQDVIANPAGGTVELLSVTWSYDYSSEGGSFVFSMDNAEAHPELKATLDSYSNIINWEPDATVDIWPAAIMRADSVVVSIMVQKRIDDQPYESEFFINIDTATGNIIKYSDICSDTDALLESVKAQMIENYGTTYPAIVDAMADATLADFVWSISYGGINFYYDKNNVDDVNGNFCAVINSDNTENLNTYYLAEPEEYIVEINRYLDIVYDFGHDGNMDMITINQIFDGDCDYPFAINGNPAQSNDGMLWFVTSGQIIHKSNGNDYIFTWQDEWSDDGPIALYELDGNQAIVIYCEEVSGGTRFVSPDTFHLCYDFDLIGNPVATMEVTFNDSGILVFDNEFYYYNEHVCDFIGPAITLIAIDAQYVDETGNVSGSVNLPEGSEIIPYRTNGYDCVDVLWNDQLVRITFDVETDDYGSLRRKISGYTVWEAFDNCLWGD